MERMILINCLRGWASGAARFFKQSRIDVVVRSLFTQTRKIGLFVMPLKFKTPGG